MGLATEAFMDGIVPWEGKAGRVCLRPTLAEVAQRMHLASISATDGEQRQRRQVDKSREQGVQKSRREPAKKAATCAMGRNSGHRQRIRSCSRPNSTVPSSSLFSERIASQ